MDQEQEQAGGRKGRRATGRPRSVERFTVAQVEDALRRAMTQAGAAALLAREQKRPCARSTVCAYVARYPRLRKVFEECQEAMVDIAETSLMQNVRNGKEASIIFLLKTRGRGRGYSERVEMEHSGETVLTVRLPETWGKEEGEAGVRSLESGGGGEEGKTGGTELQG